MTLKAWKSICQPKEFGGLGFCLFSKFNSALLAKLGWKIASGEDNLWTKLLTKKYLQEDSFFSHIPKPEASIVWRVIVSSRESLLKGTCYRLGNGLSVCTWDDPWVPTLPRHVPRCKAGIDGSR